MERTLSHKSDGRHSSAGYSVHSVHSHHSVASGRGSSLGLDTNYATTGSEDDSPLDAPAPPPGFFILGSVPSIVRCWLTTNFAHETLLYADICTGSQHSVLDVTLVKELELLDEVHKDLDGVHRIRLPVYLTEATVTHPSSRNSSPAPQMPNLVANFEVVGFEQSEGGDLKNGIKIFIGSETLREHSADVLFSQNRMTLYGSEREKLSVPFVRPEDQNAFKHIRTMTVMPWKQRLNATARPFVFNESRSSIAAAETVETTTNGASIKGEQHTPNQSMHSPVLEPSVRPVNELPSNHRSGTVSSKDVNSTDETFDTEKSVSEDNRSETLSDVHRREPSAGGIWSSWRQGAATNTADQKENTPLSGYQPAGRARNMKVLKPSKPIASASASGRIGASYELPPGPRVSIEARRKSQPLESAPTGVLRWGKSDRASAIGSERTTSVVPESKPATTTTRETRSVSSTSRTSANPVGGASAFSWMTPVGKPKSSSATTD